MSTDWRAGLWASVDIETTGAGPEDCIVEIAVVLWGAGRRAAQASWSALVNPMMPIPAEATAVHGITDAMVRDLPTIESHRADIERLLDDADIVTGYNLYAFDEPFIERELPGIFKGRHIIDPFVVVRSSHVGKFWKSDFVDRSCAICDEDKPESERSTAKPAGRHALSSVVERFGCGGPESGFEAQAHRAAWDALLASRVLCEVVGFCSSDAATCEARLRAEKARQDAEHDAFRERMKGNDAAKRERRKASLALRVQELEAKVRRLQAQLGEVAA